LKLQNKRKNYSRKDSHKLNYQLFSCPGLFVLSTEKLQNKLIKDENLPSPMLNGLKSFNFMSQSIGTNALATNIN